MKRFWKALRPVLVCFLIMTVLCGLVYPGVVTAIAQAAFPAQANGSIVTVTLKDGTKKEYGSALIAQEFTKPQYLIGRPLGATNLNPAGADEKKKVQERIAWWHGFDPANTADIPLDLVTASGSGVDPNVSPAAAEYQVARIARVRGLGEDSVRAVIAEYTAGKFLGFWGERAVNVLKVNLALDGLI
ncbi:K+-transporting ATPase ATPase C chain [Sporobacter termitidis DSM 10068]|uniref:Potassium-transporting ATPase KdpC subunit n=1 Tax=Sporobacter termitidis DSM 10068 TaxID=1123282 RepID=A0A1M5Z7R2_9FIRM|nr:potassium-transporting ATPase subunit C [Sporobacter termitidis]SHI20276.1 K+-transporting ATPase ATPase C chain [Sporobacter termitidis DSM 10068]